MCEELGLPKQEVDDVTAVIVSNIFVALANGTQRIMDVVYGGGTGAVLATYSKHELVPVYETHWVQPGPFAPTTFDHAGLR